MRRLNRRERRMLRALVAANTAVTLAETEWRILEAEEQNDLLRQALDATRDRLVDLERKVREHRWPA